MSKANTAVSPGISTIVAAQAAGGARGAICRLSPCCISTNSPFWPSGWSTRLPEWVESRGDGLYAVEFWKPEWRGVVVGGDGYPNSSALDHVTRLGFSGVLLENLDKGVTRHESVDYEGALNVMVNRLRMRGEKLIDGFEVYASEDDPHAQGLQGVRYLRTA